MARGRSPLPGRPELRQLALFATVAETRSFSETARHLGLSQPAVSQAIRRLEDMLGGDLFERRHGGPLGLTPIGKTILPSVQMVLDAVDRQMAAAVRAAQSGIGTLSLGLFAGLAAGPLRDGIADFLAASPNVRMRLVEATPSNLSTQLHRREIDMMIAALMPDVRDPHYDEDLLWRDRLVAALPADGVLAARPVLSWNLLGATPLIFRTAHQEMHAYKTLIGHPALDGSQHDVSLGTLLEMVALGIGSTILPESAATSHTGVVFRPIVEANAFVEVKAVWPRGDANPLRHRLLVHLRRHARTGPAGPISHREQAMTRAEDPG